MQSIENEHALIKQTDVVYRDGLADPAERSSYAEKMRAALAALDAVA